MFNCNLSQYMYVYIILIIIYLDKHINIFIYVCYNQYYYLQQRYQQQQEIICDRESIKYYLTNRHQSSLRYIIRILKQ